MDRRSSTVTLPVKNVTALHNGLAQLVSDKKTFNRVLWDAHGGPGRIWIGDDRIDSSTLTGGTFAGQGYERLFPGPTKFYFSGCNVAGDEGCNGSCNPATRDAGWKFLESAGKLFLHGGGYTMGWTSLGYGWKQAVFSMINNGKMFHVTGDVRHVTFGRGGAVKERLSYDGGLVTGSIHDAMKVHMKLKQVFPSDY